MSWRPSSDTLEMLLKFFPNGLCAIDLETTGLSPITDEIIEIAAVAIHSKGRIEVFEQLVKPEESIPQFSIDIHGITDQMVESAPSLADVMPRFTEFVAGRPLVAHNAVFDAGFLIKALHSLEMPFVETEIYDSCHFARSLYMQKQVIQRAPKNYKLDTLAKHFEISAFNHHRALADAVACMEIFEKTLRIFASSDVSKKFTDMSYVFNLHEFKNVNSLELPPRLTSLVPLLSNQSIAMIRYKGKKKPEGLRPVRPVGLLPLPGGIFLRALCIRSNKMKSFALERIKAVELLPPEQVQEYEKQILGGQS